MRYFIIILLLAGCAKTASQSATEVALNQVDAVEQAIKKECPQAKIDKDMDALRSSINSQLSTCELEQARTSYNYYVTSYNTLIESVPTNIIANIFAFKKASWFQAEEDKKENIKVDL